MKRNPIVLITNAVTKSNYESAAAFGEPRVLSDRIYSFTPGSPANGTLAEDIEFAMVNFDETTDYILPSGSAISTALILVALFNRGVRNVRVLLWNGNEQSYHAGLLDLNVALKGAK